jgi:hypothetical protein
MAATLAFVRSGASIGHLRTVHRRGCGTTWQSFDAPSEELARTLIIQGQDGAT